jgi:glycosyltransferase involved in cell wall biosynthesis
VGDTGSALLFNPGTHVLGGGERYTFALAEVLLDAGLSVTVAGPKLPSEEECARRNFPTRVALRELASADVARATRDVDVFVHVTTMPPVRSFARTSFAVVQFPTPWSKPWKARVHALNYRLIVYSDYVRRWVWRRWRRRATVLPPPVELGSYAPSDKESLIVTVGRIFPEFHRKRHDALIEAFTLLPDETPWRLAIAGSFASADPGSQDFLSALERRTNGRRVDIHPNVTQDELHSLYSRASLYWHGAGFGRGADEPDQVEHFGISVVEAMSYGAVPLVVDDGGLREVVPSDAGERWHSLDELAAMTTALIESPQRLATKARAAAQRSRDYAPEVFAERARRVLGLAS